MDILALSKNAKVDALPGYVPGRILLGSGRKTYDDLQENGEDLSGYDSFSNGEGRVFSFKNGGEIKQRKERG